MFAGASSFLVDGWVGDRFDVLRVAGVGRPVAASSSVFVCGSTPPPPYFAQSPPTMEVSRVLRGLVFDVRGCGRPLFWEGCGWFWGWRRGGGGVASWCRW